MVPLDWGRLWGFSAACDAQITWIFSSSRICFRTLLRTWRYAMTCWIVISASALHRWALPFRGSTVQSALLPRCSWCAGGACALGVLALKTRTPRCAQWLSWDHVAQLCEPSLFLPSPARGQAELTCRCTRRPNGWLGTGWNHAGK